MSPAGSAETVTIRRTSLMAISRGWPTAPRAGFGAGLCPCHTPALEKPELEGLEPRSALRQLLLQSQCLGGQIDQKSSVVRVPDLTPIRVASGGRTLCPALW